MKTKYILHGGSAQKITAKNTRFFQEILKDTDTKLKVLLVYFASNKANDQLNYSKDTMQFTNAGADKYFEFKIASKKDFTSQVSDSDIIYFGGGFTEKLLATMRPYIELEKLLNGKVVIGESAGANMLSAYGYSPYAKELYKGCNIIPVLTIPHYSTGTESEFINPDSTIPKNFLHEEDFRVFLID